MRPTARQVVAVVIVLSGLMSLTVAGCARNPVESSPAAATAAPAAAADAAASEPDPAEAAAEPAPPRRMIRRDAPRQYVVKRGDTLWDIAGRFLDNPWVWPQVWRANPHIRNPHLIYPKDVITLTEVNGQTRLTVQRDGQPLGSAGRPAELHGKALALARPVKLSPRVRSAPLEHARRGVPVQTVRPFLARPRLLEQTAYEAAPYIVDSQDERLVYGAGDQVYVRGLAGDAELAKLQRFEVYRRGEQIRDPATREVLGNKIIYVGDAELVRQGKPATVQLTETVREVLKGDRLLAGSEEPPIYTFFPKAPPADTQGVVVDLFNAISQIGKYQVAIVNRGKREGIERGAVFAVFRSGRVVRDEVGSVGKSRFTLPDERTGLMMVFRTFDKLSYALVMESRRPIHVGDAIKAP